MSRLWAIIQAHLDEYGVREAALARRMGTAPQTLSSWKNRGLKNLPARWLLEAVARETGTAYDAVLDAVLVDINYRKESESSGDTASTTPAGGDPAKQGVREPNARAGRLAPRPAPVQRPGDGPPHQGQP